MDSSIFIIASYSIAGVLIAGLCLATWLRARAVTRAMRERPDA